MRMGLPNVPAVEREPRAARTLARAAESGGCGSAGANVDTSNTTTYESLTAAERGVLRTSAAVPITAQNTEVAQSGALEVWSIVGTDGIDIGIWPSQRRSVSQKNGRPRGMTCKLSTMIARNLRTDVRMLF